MSDDKSSGREEAGRAGQDVVPTRAVRIDAAFEGEKQCIAAPLELVDRNLRRKASQEANRVIQRDGQRCRIVEADDLPTVGSFSAGGPATAADASAAELSCCGRRSEGRAGRRC